MWYLHPKQRMKPVFEIGKEFSKTTKTYYLVFIIKKKNLGCLMCEEPHKKSVSLWRFSTIYIFTQLGLSDFPY